jgi:predicted transcriptional regulator of viral defense system
MKARDALRKLADVSASQWGMVTSVQASARGVTRLDLSRLADAGDLERISQGVYKNAGAPAGTFLDVRAAWLSSDPARLAGERLGEGHEGVVVSGQSAAWLHDIGDLRSNRTELTSPRRRQTQRPDIHYRQRELSAQDVTIREGLPVTTPERTIADLVEDRTDLSVVANALRDAIRKHDLDLGRLETNLAPLAARNGHRKGDGAAMLDQLLAIAGMEREA